MLQKIIILLLFLSSFAAEAQTNQATFFTPADSLNKSRFWTCTIGGAATFAGVSVVLYNSWYKQFELTKFHTFNDFREWKGMDKTGHLITTYTESRLVYQAARWTGMDKNRAIWTGVGVGLLLQSSLEIMDGFSEKWGFSWSDTGTNILGASFFALQMHWWDELKFKLKVSSPPLSYSTAPIQSIDGTATSSLLNRSNDLFGTNYAELFLKDYNALTLWLSFNPNIFLKEKNHFFPKWLNVSIGYGAENLFGGFENKWTNKEGISFELPPEQFPRYRQYYLSLDIDLTKIKTRSAFLKTLFYTFNFIKIPAPALEINSLGKVRFHPLHW